ncbi:terpene cyclase [Steccherinum ochraceum]|uniref:Terpene cyclase n=1 Tax=Steccherinum ochraceum TaxID=92696 RepID=A0A4R0RY51_9APHY|nr:terpene cyclase [Steccherinum ochraceum]
MAVAVLSPVLHLASVEPAASLEAQNANVCKRQLLLDFIKRTGVSDNFHWGGMDTTVSSKALEIAKSWNLGLSDAVLEKYLWVGLVIGTTGYRHTPIDVQVLVSVYTLCATMCDDHIMTNEMIREFGSRFFSGQPQLHPILTALVECLSTSRQHCSPYMSNTIAVSTVDFLNAEMFMRDEGGSDLQVPEAASYIDYLRWKTGVGEAYAAFIWPKSLFPETKTYIQAMPDAVQFICLCNDLFSFHKEDKAGETDNYVSQRTAALRQSPLDTLEETVSRLVALDGSIKAVLGNSPERRAWEAFAGGYTEFHLYTPRYFLNELLPEFY